jgi:hypothetical protein
MCHARHGPRLARMAARNDRGEPVARRLVWIVSVVLVAACARGDAGAIDSPASAPFRLATVTWPADVTALDAVFAALPDQLSGQPRLDGGYQTAIYGEGKDRVATIYAVDLGAAACPGMSGGSLVRSTLEQRGGALKIDEQSPDEVADGAPAYLVGTRGGANVVAWSIGGAHWVIAIEATSDEARAEAAAAVVGAVSSAGATAGTATPSAN